MTLQQTYSRTTNILEKFQEGEDGLKILYQPGLISPLDMVGSLRFYGFLTSLRMRVDINSLSEQEVPNIAFEDTEAERLIKIRDMEWKSPRKQINFYMKQNSKPWYPIFEVSLLNRLPYYTVNLLQYLTDNLSFDFANDTILGAQIVEVGWGTLIGTDSVTIYGCVKEELITLPTDSPVINYSQSYGWDIDNQSQVILPANSNRLQVTLVNRGTEDVFISYGPIATLGQGITLMANGGSYEINFSNPYRGAISAIAFGNTHLTGIEAV